MSKDKVLRGGSYNCDSRILRTTDRLGDGPGNRNWNGGFRLVVTRGVQ